MRRSCTFVLSGLASLAFVAACNSSPESPAAPDAEATCPESLSDALTVACAPEGLRCYPQYDCGITSAIATCTCTGGSFSCADVTGKSLGEGGAPRCPSPAAAGTCPVSETIARQRACTEPRLMCFYPSTCSGSQEYDTCECSPETLADGQPAFVFDCTTPCDYDVALIDAGADGAYDATVTDAPGLDARVEAAPAE